MRIAINAASAKMSGAVTYLTSLLRHLPPPESGYRFYVFLPGETATRLRNLRGNIELYPLPVKNSDGWRRLWWEQVTLRRFLRKEHVDALFSSANFAMLRCPVKQILLVRNAMYFSKRYQEMFLGKHSLRFRLAFGLRRWLIVASVRSADVVMTPTRAMLDELAKFVNLSSRNVLVNYYGADQPSAPLEDSAESCPVTTPQVFRLIYVSLYSNHKNLSTLLKAMPLLNRDGAARFVLKTTVDPAWDGAAWTVTHKADLALARQPHVARWVEFLGPLRNEQVQELYMQSDVSVFPSLCESFGHPMVEAMAHSLPIVASDIPVNREICGDAALYFRPLDSEDLARQIRRVTTDAALRERIRAKAQERARTKFRWGTHVRNILVSCRA